MEKVVIKIHPDDNVLVALKDIAAGSTIVYGGEAFIIIEDMPARHKFFMQDMPVGSEIKMYGVLVGTTVTPVNFGARMTTANLQHAATSYTWRNFRYQWQPPGISKFKNRTFSPGLTLVCTPGNDVEATTGKAASGATLILFTTAPGTPTGNPVCSTIKVATNTALAKRMSDIIDINTGSIIEGATTIQQAGEEIPEYCIKAAGGAIIPKAVQLNQDDFIPWKRGISL